MKKIIIIMLVLLLVGCSGEDKAIEEFSEVLAEQNFDQVIVLGTDLIAEYPENTTVLMGLGMAYARTGEFEKSEEVLSQYRSIKTDDAAEELYASVLVHLGQFDDAEEICLTLVESMPNNYNVLNLLSSIYASSDEYAKATFYGEKAWAINDTNPFLAVNMCISYYRLGDTDKMEVFFNHAKELGYVNIDQIDEIIHN
jgi:Flp pilus assembly protein TadD